jgi:DNA-binding FrmR family transcriptional regulator
MTTIMNTVTKTSLAVCLKWIEGQVRGILQMVDESRSCVDVLTQISAVSTALHKVEDEILRDQVFDCVANAFASVDAEDQHRNINTLVDTLGRRRR